MSGWIALHRKLLKSPLAKNADAMHLWIHLLLTANHKDGEFILGNQVIKIPKGSIMTGRIALQTSTGLNQHKVDRLLKLFVNMQFIEQQTFSKYRLVSITNWGQYQEREQQVSNKRAASEQQVSTNNNVNKGNNVNKREGEKSSPPVKKAKQTRFAPPTLEEIKNHIVEKKYIVNADTFFNYYESNGWKVSKNSMKSWEASLAMWNSREKPSNKKPMTEKDRFYAEMRGETNSAIDGEYSVVK